MSLRIQTNIEAYDAHRNLVGTQKQLATAMERLSSGFRINRAADDAAGLAISEKLHSQIGGLDQAARNAQDAVSLVQTGEGALAEVQSMLQRVRDLAVQFNNGTLSASDQAAITAEVAQLCAEISDIGKQTAFNGINLLNASSTITFQVGANDGADRHGLAVIGADLERDRAARIEQVDPVERGLLADVGDLSAELSNLGRDGGLIRRRQGAVVELHREVTHALEHRLYLGERAFTGLNERDRVLRVARSLVESTDLRMQLLADREAGGVVGGAVDAEARGQALHRGRQHLLRADEVAVGVVRLDVGLN